MAREKSIRRKKPSGKNKTTSVKLQARPKQSKKPTSKKHRTRGENLAESRVVIGRRGLGSGAAGQSGDIEGLATAAGADSESVEELAEEGQSFEAEVISGVEGALDPDEAEVTTHEVPEDDIPAEYEDNRSHEGGRIRRSNTGRGRRRPLAS
jgi:hypothetical protein